MEIRTTVRNAAELIGWAVAAEKGQPATYHIGDLARDRSESRELHMLAETVLILSECGFIVPRQVIMRLPMGSVTWYSVVRTGSGWVPRSIMFDQCDAFAYRALQAVNGRDASQSAHRAIRDQFGCSESMALDYLALLYASNWIEKHDAKGWQLSPEGIRMLT